MLTIFKLYLYTAIAPVPLSAFVGEPGQSFIKSYSAVCLEGAIIVLAVEEDRMRGSKGCSAHEVAAMMRSAIKEAAGHGTAE